MSRDKRRSIKEYTLLFTSYPAKLGHSIVVDFQVIKKQQPGVVDEKVSAQCIRMHIV